MMLALAISSNHCKKENNIAPTLAQANCVTGKVNAEQNNKDGTKHIKVFNIFYMSF